MSCIIQKSVNKSAGAVATPCTGRPNKNASSANAITKDVRISLYTKHTKNLNNKICFKCSVSGGSDHINCQICRNTYHAKCVRVDSRWVSEIRTEKRIFQCNKCTVLLQSRVFRDFYDGIGDDFSRLEAKNQQVSKDVSLTEEKIINLEKQLLELNKILNNCVDASDKLEESIHNKSVIESPDSSINESVDDLSGTYEDKYEKTIRQNRVVMFEVPLGTADPDDSDDFSYVSYLIRKINKANGRVIRWFRVLSGKNASSRNPPLIIELGSWQEKKSFLKQCRDFSPYNAAPDISYKDRQKYKILKDERNIRNSELQNRGIDSEKWIIRKLKLTLIALDQVEGENE